MCSKTTIAMKNAKTFVKFSSFIPYILVVVSVSVVASVFLFLKPIAQNAHYHAFANEFNFCGISNFANIISNLGFVLVGAIGLHVCIKHKQFNLVHITLVLGIFLTGFGSAYYHFAPNNSTLVWDRIPMTLIFSSFFALILSKYFSEKTARIVWVINASIGILSVLYWQYTESLGRGDLRLYAIVQFLPMLLIIIMLLLNQQTNKQLFKTLVYVMFWYIVAKLFEYFDHHIFEIIHLISGHPLKHIAASIATYYMLALLKPRNDFTN